MGKEQGEQTRNESRREVLLLLLLLVVMMVLVWLWEGQCTEEEGDERRLDWRRGEWDGSVMAIRV